MKNPPPQAEWLSIPRYLDSSSSDSDDDTAPEEWAPPMQPSVLSPAGDGDDDLDSVWSRRRGTGAVVFEGSDVASEGGGAGGVSRSRSLTDDDLEELKGCHDLGFGFSYDEIPELCATLPALELCYSMSQKYFDEQNQQQQQRLAQASGGAEGGGCASSSPPPPIASWKIASPGDDPEDVKARLKYWAQAVAWTVRLCNC